MDLNNTQESTINDFADTAIVDNTQSSHASNTKAVDKPVNNEAKIEGAPKPTPQKKKKSARNKSKTNQNRPGPKSSFDIVANTSSMSVSYRTVQIHNNQLVNQLVYCSRITRTLMTMTGALVRCKQFDIQKSFDEYVDLLLSTNIDLIQAQIDADSKTVNDYESQGYEFVENGTPAKVRVEVRSNHVATLIELILKIDQAMTLAARLEKTPALTTPELYELFKVWITIPRRINSRLMSLMDVLDKTYRFKVTPQSNQKSAESVVFSDVHAFMLSLKDDAAVKTAEELDDGTKNFEQNAAVEKPHSKKLSSAEGTKNTNEPVSDTKISSEKSTEPSKKPEFLNWQQ